MTRQRWTYHKAGVDLKAVKHIQKNLQSILVGDFTRQRVGVGRVHLPIGHYAGLIDLGDSRCLALHVDGVGTKVFIAQLMNRYDTVGIDCVAMCVNDIVCVGAKPLALLDYLVVERPNPKMIKALMKGLAEGAKIAGTKVVGGETAVMPDLIRGVAQGAAFDLAAMCAGIVDEKGIITGEEMKPGDVILGLESSGLHSNGYTLARKVLLEESQLTIQSRPSHLKGATLGEELLKPTKIYSNVALDVLKKCHVHALAHITGGAYTKMSRFWDYQPVGFKLDQLPPPAGIFQLLQEKGNIPLEEMYRTFNMGIGFLIVLPPNQAEKARRITAHAGFNSRIVGEIIPEKEITVTLGTKTFRLT